MAPHRNYTLAALVLCLGSMLSWSIQPLAARALLPIFGGSSAVWTSSLVFFQTTLLFGYLLGHWVAGRSKVALGTVLILIAFTLLRQPVSFMNNTVVEHPAVDVWILLALAVALPSLILYACSPIVQWVIGDAKGQSTFTLFAWSNVGSLAGLVSYPFLVEPYLSLQRQLTVWSLLFAIIGVLLSIILITHHISNQHEATRIHKLSLRWSWVCPSALGVALLVGVSDAISVDLTVTPILWILPLAVYLLTFIITFGFPGIWVGRIAWSLALIAIALFLYLRVASWSVHWSIQLAGWCAVLAIGCLHLHAELVRRQPATEDLTSYYVSIATGGVLGGAVVGFIIPSLIQLRLEVDITFIVCVYFLWNSSRKRKDQTVTFATIYPSTIIAALALVSLGATLCHKVVKELSGDTYIYRNAYGTLKVKKYAVPKKRGGLVHLLDGRISHGFQYLGDDHKKEPTAYFTAKTGIGRVLSNSKKSRKVGILGLGVGTLSAYSRPGDEFTFFELNPLVVDIARKHFNYLSDAEGQVDIVLGDGRKSLEKKTDQRFDVLIIDAFTGDAIPAHLLTVEAFKIYLGKLGENGLIAVNVSNRHADLRQVIEGVCNNLKLAFSWVRHRSKSPLGPYVSEWAFVANGRGTLQQSGLPIVATNEAAVIWRDDFAPLLTILK